ncbi:MAG TPA: phosphoglucosamine mutase [bacterium]|nr:phosphoglucosamine mutase [bacterium]HQL64045.1 phosphoglucosamine mutase [bacterium]
MKLPRITISGARGIVGDDLTVESAVRLSRAFGRLLGKGTVVIGRDARPSGQMIEAAVASGLMAEGCGVVRLGLVPTPTVGIMVRELGARGAVNVTASHNPVKWNALKLYNEQGLFISPAQIKRLVELAQDTDGHATGTTCGQSQDNDMALGIHCRRVHSHIESLAIIARAYFVAVDGCRSVGGIFLPRLLRELGCEVIELDCEADGRFTRPLEPNPAVLERLCERVRSRKCAVGFAVDPDADRLSLVDEQGVAIGEEYTLALAVKHVLSRRGGGTAVVNLSSSMMVDAAATLAGGRVVRTPIGEAHVVEGMIREKAVIGGEGNGGVIFPDIHPGRDAMAAAGLILEAMALSGKPLSALAAELPKTTILKDKLEIASFPGPDWVQRAAAGISHGTIDTTDGLKVILPDGWYHVRLSNTEPIFRNMAEAATSERAQLLLDMARKVALAAAKTA